MTVTMPSRNCGGMLNSWMVLADAAVGTAEAKCANNITRLILLTPPANRFPPFSAEMTTSQTLRALFACGWQSSAFSSRKKSSRFLCSWVTKERNFGDTQTRRFSSGCRGSLLCWSAKACIPVDRLTKSLLHPATLPLWGRRGFLSNGLMPERSRL